jgi:hypothetical protein
MTRDHFCKFSTQNRRISKRGEHQKEKEQERERNETVRKRIHFVERANVFQKPCFSDN